MAVDVEQQHDQAAPGQAVAETGHEPGRTGEAVRYNDSGLAMAGSAARTSRSGKPLMVVCLIWSPWSASASPNPPAKAKQRASSARTQLVEGGSHGLASAAILRAMSYPHYSAYPKGSPGLWLGLSIVATIMCCLPLGVVGIIYAAKAMNEHSRGDYYAAVAAVGSARRWTIASFLSIALVLVAVLIAAVLSRTSQFSPSAQP